MAGRYRELFTRTETERDRGKRKIRKNGNLLYRRPSLLEDR
jgi:hypothetical protein